MQKAILKNLKDQILTDDNSVMKCFKCGCEYSANSGDYWNIKDKNYKFKCCNKTMSIVKKSIVYS